MKYTIDEYAKERTVNWLNGMQSNGKFKGFPEDDDEVSYETELIETRKKLLENI